MKQEFSKRLTKTPEVANGITDEELCHKTFWTVEQKALSKKMSDSNITLNNKALEKMFPLNLKLIPKK